MKNIAKLGLFLLLSLGCQKSTKVYEFCRETPERNSQFLSAATEQGCTNNGTVWNNGLNCSNVSITCSTSAFGRLDFDQDGVMDNVDQCLQEPARNEADPARPGCVAPDRDLDFTPDHVDLCPDEPAGSDPDIERRGCPLPGRGSCVGADRCADYPENTPTSVRLDSCGGNNGTYSTSSCPTSNRSGSCVTTSGLIFRWYLSDTTVAFAREICARLEGSFTPN